MAIFRSVHSWLFKTRDPKLKPPDASSSEPSTSRVSSEAALVQAPKFQASTGLPSRRGDSQPPVPSPEASPRAGTRPTGAPNSATIRASALGEITVREVGSRTTMGDPAALRYTEPSQTKPGPGTSNPPTLDRAMSSLMAAINADREFKIAQLPMRPLPRHATDAISSLKALENWALSQMLAACTPGQLTGRKPEILRASFNEAEAWKIFKYITDFAYVHPDGWVFGTDEYEKWRIVVQKNYLALLLVQHESWQAVQLGDSEHRDRLFRGSCSRMMDETIAEFQREQKVLKREFDMNVTALARAVGVEFPVETQLVDNPFLTYNRKVKPLDKKVDKKIDIEQYEALGQGEPSVSSAGANGITDRAGHHENLGTNAASNNGAKPEDNTEGACRPVKRKYHDRVKSDDPPISSLKTGDKDYGSRNAFIPHFIVIDMVPLTSSVVTAENAAEYAGSPISHTSIVEVDASPELHVDPDKKLLALENSLVCFQDDEDVPPTSGAYASSEVGQKIEPTMLDTESRRNLGVEAQREAIGNGVRLLPRKNTRTSASGIDDAALDCFFEVVNDGQLFELCHPAEADTSNDENEGLEYIRDAVELGQSFGYGKKGGFEDTLGAAHPSTSVTDAVCPPLEDERIFDDQILDASGIAFSSETSSPVITQRLCGSGVIDWFILDDGESTVTNASVLASDRHFHSSIANAITADECIDSSLLSAVEGTPCLTNGAESIDETDWSLSPGYHEAQTTASTPAQQIAGTRCEKASVSISTPDDRVDSFISFSTPSNSSGQKDSNSTNKVKRLTTTRPSAGNSAASSPLQTNNLFFPSAPPSQPESKNHTMLPDPEPEERPPTNPNVLHSLSADPTALPPQNSTINSLTQTLASLTSLTTSLHILNYDINWALTPRATHLTSDEDGRDTTAEIRALIPCLGIAYADLVDLLDGAFEDDKAGIRRMREAIDRAGTVREVEGGEIWVFWE